MSGIRTIRLMGECPCCKRAWAELVLCTCGHKIVNHRIDLKYQKCEIARCKCKQQIPAPDQEDRVA